MVVVLDLRAHEAVVEHSGGRTAGRWALYLLLILISPSGMSLGDVKLAASLGTLLAWFGWRLLIAGGFAGLCLGALAAGALLASRRVSRKHLIPFGPFMIAGAVLAVIAWPR